MNLTEIRDFLIEQDDEDILFIFQALEQEIRARKEEDEFRVIL